MTDPTTQFVHFSTFILGSEQVVELAQLPGTGAGTCRLFPLAAKHRHLLPPRGRELGHHLGPRLPPARSWSSYAMILGFGTTVEDAWQTDHIVTPCLHLV